MRSKFMANTRNEFVFQPARFEEANIHFSKFFYLQVKRFVEPVQLVAVSFHAIQHFVEGDRQFLKLIARSVKEEVDGVHTIQEYLRGNFFWCKLLANYTRSPRDRKYLRELLGPLIHANIIEDPALDLESDPMQIYRSAINNEELRTGRPSQRPLDIPREIAIKDPETRDMFIDHLRDLREISDQFLLALEALLHKMPYGIRFICQQTFESLCEHFPREPQKHLLQIQFRY